MGDWLQPPEANVSEYLQDTEPQTAPAALSTVYECEWVVMDHVK